MVPEIEVRELVRVGYMVAAAVRGLVLGMMATVAMVKVEVVGAVVEVKVEAGAAAAGVAVEVVAVVMVAVAMVKAEAGAAAVVAAVAVVQLSRRFRCATRFDVMQSAVSIMKEVAPNPDIGSVRGDDATDALMLCKVVD
eukprot:jgi/Tetstr1/437518/TSEL_026196.t1